jgi:hypothetical protein
MALDTPFLVPVAIDDVRKRDALVPRPFLEVHWAHLPREVPPGPEFVAHVRTLLAQGTLRGETLLHAGEAGRLRRDATPAPADRSLAIRTVPTGPAAREPTGATVLPGAPAPSRPFVAAAKPSRWDAGEQQAARRFRWLLAGMAVIAVGITLWFLLRA